MKWFASVDSKRLSIILRGDFLGVAGATSRVEKEKQYFLLVA
jgi:hypothetical protein